MGKIYLVIMTLILWPLPDESVHKIHSDIQIIEFDDLESCLVMQSVVGAGHRVQLERHAAVDAANYQVTMRCVDPEWLYANRREDFRWLFTGELHSYDPSWSSLDNEGSYADRPK